MVEKLISFDLRADFGFFKKPDVNEGLVMTFNMLHRPALLGLLGAIAGLNGYDGKDQKVAYLEAFGRLQIGIEPLNFADEPKRHDRGNFQKTVLKYSNTVGYANANETGKSGANLLVTEQTLIRPAFRCYVLLDLSNEIQAVLHGRIMRGEAHYLPYFGKNDCLASWGNVQEYQFEPFQKATEKFKIQSIFIRKNSISASKAATEVGFDFDLEDDFSQPMEVPFMYFERLPTGFEEKLPQYKLAEFALTTFFLKPETMPDHLFSIKNKKNESAIIQLFK